MARIIGISNKKGGTGKTTTAVNLSAGLAIFKRKKILLIDADSQANATVSLGLLPTLTPSLEDLLRGNVSIESVIYKTSIDGLYILPSTPGLSKVEPVLFYKNNGEFVLRKALSLIEKDFDFIIIDSPPTINMVSLNVLIASTELIIPLRKEFLSMEGTNQFFTVVSKVINKKNPALRIDGVLFTGVLPQEKNSEKEVFYFGSVSIRRLRSEIRFDKNLAEAPKYGKPIFLFAPSSMGAEDYKKLVEEIGSMEM